MVLELVELGENMAMIPYVPFVDTREPLYIFEQMVLRRPDTMASNQRDHYEFCAARFQHLDDQIEVVRNQLAELTYDKGT